MSDEEEWKPIPGWEGIYEISSLGRLRSLARVVKRGGLDMRVAERILKPNHAEGKYDHAVLQANGIRKDIGVHQLVMLAFVGPVPESSEVLHINGNMYDNRAVNLRYGTSRENALDTLAHGHHKLASKTLCIFGHRLMDPNLVESEKSRGHRKCRACNSARAYVYRHKSMSDNFENIADGYYFKYLREAA